MSDHTLYKTAAGASQPYLFDAVLYPHRSLGRRGFFALMVVLLGMSIAVGGLFWSRGAWPVSGFYGLEIIVVWLAFRASYMTGRDYETIRLSARELVVEEHSNRQGQKRWVFNPAWVRVQLVNAPEHDSRLMITVHGRGVQVGDFLTAAERHDIARALQAALLSQKSGWRAGA